MGEQREALTISKEALKRAKLEPDETILWTGRPDPMESIKTMDRGQVTLAVIFVFVFVLPFIGAAGMKASAHPENAGRTVLALGIILVVVMAFPIIWKAWEYFIAKETTYLMTNKRAIVLKPDRVYEFKVGIILHRVARNNELSDIVLDRIMYAGRNGSSRIPVGFRCIKNTDADIVEPLILKVLDPPEVTRS